MRGPFALSTAPGATTSRRICRHLGRRVPLHDLASGYADLPHLAVVSSGPKKEGGGWTYLLGDPAGVLEWDSRGVVIDGEKSAFADGLEALDHLLDPVEPAVS